MLKLAKATTDSGWSLTGFGRPFGLHIDHSSFYVTDMDLHCVFKISHKCDTYQTLGFNEPAQGWSDPLPISEGVAQIAKSVKPQSFNGPHSIDIDSFGRLFVLTYYSPDIICLTNAGEIITCASSENRLNLSGPATARLNRSGQLLITEYKQSSVIISDLGFNLIHKLPETHELSFDRPHMAIETESNQLIIVDTWNNRLVKISADQETFLILDKIDSPHSNWHISENECSSSTSIENNKLNCPVAIDRHSVHDLLAVTDWGNDRILVLDLEGRIIFNLDSLNLKKPYDTRFFSTGILTADAHNGRVLFTDLKF